MTRQIIAILLIVLVLALQKPTAAFAYIDPNSVGFVSQFLAPLGTLLVSCLVYFRRTIGKGLTLTYQWLRKRRARSTP
jgi:hypothetical protein